MIMYFPYFKQPSFKTLGCCCICHESISELESMLITPVLNIGLRREHSRLNLGTEVKKGQQGLPTSLHDFSWYVKIYVKLYVFSCPEKLSRSLVVDPSVCWSVRWDTFVKK